MTASEILLDTGDLRLRPVGPDAVDRLTRLQRSAYAPWLPVIGREPLPYRADYRRLLEDHEAWLATDPDDRELGALVIGMADDHLLIWSVAVASGLHGRGIGRALVAAAEALAVRRGRTEVRLYTNLLMARNIRLYAALGYRETHREVTPDGRHVVHMAKPVGGDALNR